MPCLWYLQPYICSSQVRFSGCLTQLVGGKLLVFSVWLSHGAPAVWATTSAPTQTTDEHDTEPVTASKCGNTKPTKHNLFNSEIFFDFTFFHTHYFHAKHEGWSVKNFVCRTKIHIIPSSAFLRYVLQSWDCLRIPPTLTSVTKIRTKIKPLMAAPFLANNTPSKVQICLVRALVVD